MRGEKMIGTAKCKPKPGSPPHARGKEHDRAHLLAQRGITPACAGKSANARQMALRGRDHPRMRGEKSKAEGVIGLRKGSPPHARGKVSASRRLRLTVGITPACAGKRAGSRRSAWRAWDHPRMRGEKEEHITHAVHI